MTFDITFFKEHGARSHTPEKVFVTRLAKLPKKNTWLRSEFSFVRGNLLVLIVSYTIFRMLDSVSSPFQPLYVRALGASPFVLGLISSLGSLLIALVRVPGSFIADRYGRRAVIAIFTFGGISSYFFYALAPNWRFVLLGVVISSLSHVYLPALEAIEADSIPADKRGMGYSAINIIPMLPAVAAPLVGGFLVERMGLVPGMRIAYAVAFTGGIANGLLRALFLRETLERSEEVRSSVVGSASKAPLGYIFEAWRELPRGMSFLAVVMLIGAFEAPLFQVFMALYAKDVVGIWGLEWSLMSTAFMMTSLLVGLPAGKMIDSMGGRRALLAAYVFSTPMILLFITSRGVLQLLVANVLFAVGQAILFPTLMALQADLVPQDRRGRIMGIVGTLKTLAAVPSATLFGILYQVNPATPFLLAMLLEAIAVIITLKGIK